MNGACNELGKQLSASNEKTKILLIPVEDPFVDRILCSNTAPELGGELAGEDEWIEKSLGFLISL